MAPFTNSVVTVKAPGVKTEIMGTSHDMAARSMRNWAENNRSVERKFNGLLSSPKLASKPAIDRPRGRRAVFQSVST
jgi:hypothetical protein